MARYNQGSILKLVKQTNIRNIIAENASYPTNVTGSDEFFPISTLMTSKDFEMFRSVINVGIDSHLKGFTKSKFEKKGDRFYMNFHKSEIPILLGRLRELGTNEAELWAEDIENVMTKENGEEILIRTSYETVTPESAEEGDAADRGWEDEEGEQFESVEDAIEWLKRKGVQHASSSHFHPGIWYSSGEDQDFGTGETTTYSFHLTADEKVQKAIYDALKAKKVI